MIDVIQFKEHTYPAFQGQGFAAQFAFPFASKVCIGKGLDIGCNRMEWCFPGADPIDIALNGWDAMNLPDVEVDYIFSSHCLEHLPDWVGALDHWKTRLKPGASLFLYLPHPSQQYWRPWNNRKHVHVLFPEILRDYLIDRGWQKVFVSGVDLNNSFMVMAEKP